MSNWTENVAPTWDTQVESRIISDEDPRVPGYDRGEIHECTNEHNAPISWPFTISYPDYPPGRGWQFRTTGVMRRQPPIMQAPVFNWKPLLSSFYQAIDPRGPVGFSLFQNLYELRETSRMFRQGYNLLKSASDKVATRLLLGRPAAYSTVLNKDKKNVHDLIGAIDDGWLAWRYGVNPLLKDLVAFANQVSAVQKRINHVIEHRFLTDVVRVRDTVETPKRYALPGTGSVYLDCTERTQFCIGATCHWPNIEANDLVLEDMFLRYYGLTDILSNIWEVLPFSFVADWVLDVGSWLERNQFASMEPDRPYYEVRVGHEWYSYKMTRHFTGVEWDRQNSDMWGTVNPYPPGSMQCQLFGPEQTKYVRKKGLPSGYDSPELLTGLTMTHLADALCIVRNYV